MAKPPSLQDVAKAAGLSPATVSRYLNGSLALPEATSQRIDQAIRALNYRPNPHARSLSRGRSDTIGLVIPDIANPFFARLAAAVGAAADEAGLALMLCSSLNRAEREIDYLERLRQNFVDGLLLATNHPDNGRLAEAIDGQETIVIVDEDIESCAVPKVFADNIQGGSLAAAHLLAAGHRRLAFVGGPETIMSTRERAEGFRRIVAASGVAEIAIACFGDYSVPFGRRAISDILANQPDVTAIFVASDEILYGMLDVLRERAIAPGRDLSIITYDDAGPIAFFDPPVTAIRQPIAAIGRTGVELLLGRLAGQRDNPVIRLPVELIERQSVRRLA